jgi:glycine/D-amino acid oxidase-like deaminating enzyme
MTADVPREVDAIVVGAGVFGCALASQLSEDGYSVLLVDREAQPLLRASINNQARVHQGYHYPRSILTAMRSRINFAKFVADYGDCVVRSHPAYYAVARSFSKINAYQFRRFCQSVGASVSPVSKEVRGLFHGKLIEDVYLVEEPAFDARVLRERLGIEIAEKGVDLRLNCDVSRLTRHADGMDASLVFADQGALEHTVRTKLVLNCTYSNLNGLLHRSGLETYLLKHELAEMALVSLPEPLCDMSITVMDGPFFSLMPFPAAGRGLHTFSHVRYTPHYAWWEKIDSESPLTDERLSKQRFLERESNFRFMKADAARYIPLLAEARQHDSIWEMKTLLPRSEIDDSRPILFAPNKRDESVISVLGGKIDNLYDARERLREHLGRVSSVSDGTRGWQ